jgi:hypothetical protein
MGKVTGKITERILRVFKPGSAAYRPPADRNDSPARGRAIPPHVEGHAITGRKPRRGK